MSAPIEGVYLSERLKLDQLFEQAFAPYADRLRLRRPDQIDDPSKVRFALCWAPPADGFKPYQNIVHASSIAAGVDSIVRCPSLPDNVIVTRVRDEDQGDMMAGFAVWNLIWHQRQMLQIVEQWQKQHWQRTWLRRDQAPRLNAVGVLGYGLMGERVARAIAALGFPVLAASRSARAESVPGVTVLHGPQAIEAVAAQSHYLINLLPLTDQTRDVLNADLFAKMPKGAVLIQLGRGEHLVDADLDAALASGQISAATLDVFRKEPLPEGHHWWRDPRILITPHQASDTTRETVAEQAVQSLEEILAGRIPATAIDRTHGY